MCARLLITHMSPVVSHDADLRGSPGGTSGVRSCRPRLSAAGTRYAARPLALGRSAILPLPTGRETGRSPTARASTFERDFTVFAAGSVLVTTGKHEGALHRLCRGPGAAVAARRGKGWVTAEYSLLPGSSAERIGREAAKGRQSGRTQEIQRLIGRSLRAVTDLVAMGELQVTVDCDVLQADGGTRTAGICGAYVALHDCFSSCWLAATIRRHPITDACGAVSVGVVDGACLLDLDYSEDSRAEVDMNVVMTGFGPVHRGSGNGRGPAVQPRRARRDAGVSPNRGIAELIAGPASRPGGAAQPR